MLRMHAMVPGVCMQHAGMQQAGWHIPHVPQFEAFIVGPPLPAVGLAHVETQHILHLHLDGLAVHCGSTGHLPRSKQACHRAWWLCQLHHCPCVFLSRPHQDSVPREQHGLRPGQQVQDALPDEPRVKHLRMPTQNPSSKSTSCKHVIALMQ